MTYNPSVSQRIAWVLFFTQSLFSAAFIAMGTLLAITATDLSGSEKYSGIPNSVNPLVQAASAYPLGYLMGRFGRRLGLSLGYSLAVLGAAMGVIAIQEHSFVLLLVSSGLMGAGRAGADQSRFTAAEVFPEERRASAIGMIVFAGTIGAVVGPALISPAEHLAGEVGLKPESGAWFVATLFFALAFLVTFFLLRPDPREIARSLSRMVDINALENRPARPMREVFRDPQVQLALASMVIGQTVMVAIMVMTPLYMRHHNHGKEAISVVFMAHTLGMFGIAPLTGRLIERFGRVNMILAGAVVLIASAVIAPLSSAMPALIFALFILGVGWNFCFVSGSSLLSVAVSTEERGQVQGINDMLVSFSAALGSFSSGLLFDQGGYLAVTAAGFLLTLVLTGMVGSLAPRQVEQRVLEGA